MEKVKSCAMFTMLLSIDGGPWGCSVRTSPVAELTLTSPFPWCLQRVYRILLCPGLSPSAR